MPVPDRPGVLAEVTTLLGELDVNIFDLEIAHSPRVSGASWCWSSMPAARRRALRAVLARGYRPALRRLG